MCTNVLKREMKLMQIQKSDHVILQTQNWGSIQHFEISSRQKHFLQPGTCKEGGLSSRKLQRLNTGTKIQHHTAFIKSLCDTNSK